MKSSSAYTLIELLVVITIGIIVFGTGLAGYREFSRRQSLTGILSQTKSDLRLIQQLALTGQKPEGVSCTVLNGYTFTSTSSAYKLFANCFEDDYEIKNVDMPDDVTITASSVMYKVLGQGTNLLNSVTLTITNSLSSVNGTIVLGVGGDIK